MIAGRPDPVTTTKTIYVGVMRTDQHPNPAKVPTPHRPNTSNRRDRVWSNRATPPRLVLDACYVPYVCAAPTCELPPHVAWIVVTPGTLFGRDWEIGDIMHLCGVHEQDPAVLASAHSTISGRDYA